MHVGYGAVWPKLCGETCRCLNGHRYVRTIESVNGRVRIPKAAGAHAMEVRLVEALPHPKTCIVAHGGHNVMKRPRSRRSWRRPGKIAQADPAHSAVLGRRLVPQADVGDVVCSSADRSTPAAVQRHDTKDCYPARGHLGQGASTGRCKREPSGRVGQPERECPRTADQEHAVRVGLGRHSRSRRRNGKHSASKQHEH